MERGKFILDPSRPLSGRNRQESHRQHLPLFTMIRGMMQKQVAAGRAVRPSAMPVRSRSTAVKVQASGLAINLTGGISL